MILRGVGLGLLLVTVLLLQTVVAPGVRLGGLAPNLVVLSVLSVGMIAGPGPGLRYGFAAGLAIDLLSGPESILGVSVLLLLLGGHAAGLAKPFIAASLLPGQMLVGGLGVIVLRLLTEAFEVLLGRAASALMPLLLDTLVAGAFAAVVAPLLCLVVERLQRALPDPG